MLHVTSNTWIPTTFFKPIPITTFLTLSSHVIYLFSSLKFVKMLSSSIISFRRKEIQVLPCFLPKLEGPLEGPFGMTGVDGVSGVAGVDGPA